MDWGNDADNIHNIDKLLLTKACLTFIFGNHVLYTYKYFRFFKKNQIIDNINVHKFFMYINLFVNIIYCIVFNIAFFEFFFYYFSRHFSLNAILDLLLLIGLLFLNLMSMNHPLLNSLLEEKGMSYIDYE